MYALVAEKGYDKASMNQVCAAVGVSKPALYYYFASKEELFLDMVKSLYPVLDPDDTEGGLDRRPGESTIRICMRWADRSSQATTGRRAPTRFAGNRHAGDENTSAVAQHQQRLTKTTIEARSAAVLKHGAGHRALPALRCRERGAIPVRHHFGFQHARGAECGRRRCRRVEQSSRPALLDAKRQ